MKTTQSLLEKQSVISTLLLAYLTICFAILTNVSTYNWSVLCWQHCLCNTLTPVWKQHSIVIITLSLQYLRFVTVTILLEEQIANLTRPFVIYCHFNKCKYIQLACVMLATQTSCMYSHLLILHKPSLEDK